MADGRRGPQKSDNRIKVEKTYSRSIRALQKKKVPFELTPENYKNLLKQIRMMKKLSDDDEVIFNITKNKIRLFFHLDSPELAEDILSATKFLFKKTDETISLIEKVNEIALKQVYNKLYRKG